MTTLDTLIYCLIDKDIISEEVKRKLISHFKSWVSFIGTKNFAMKNYLFQAYINYLDQKNELMRKNLLHYAINLTVIYGNEKLHQGNQKMEQLFNLNFDYFIQIESSKALKIKSI